MIHTIATGEKTLGQKAVKMNILALITSENLAARFQEKRKNCIHAALGCGSDFRALKHTIMVFWKFWRHYVVIVN